MKRKINIVLCDDEYHFLKLLKDKCTECLKSTQYSVSINDFSSGYALLNDCAKIDIAILDVNMPEIDGLSLAEQINVKFDYAVRIIFLTSYTKPMQKAFAVKAFRYLLKPINEEEFSEVLHEAINDLVNQSYILVSNRQNSWIVNRNEIIYVESLGDGSIIVEQNDNYVNSNTIKFWKDILCNSYFAYIHRSYIVNLKYVKSYKAGFIYLFDDQKLPVSIRKRKETMNSIYAFVAENAKKR